MSDQYDPNRPYTNPAPGRDQYDLRDGKGTSASVDAPAQDTAPHPELFTHVDTATLQRQHDALRAVIPGDPTVIVTLAGIMRNLLGRALVHPDRIKRDEALAADNRKRADEQAAASLKARQDAEREQALPLSAEDRRKRDAEALDRKHKAEQAALERDRASTELTAKQQQEQRELTQRQTEERSKVLAPTPAESRDNGNRIPNADRLPNRGPQNQGPAYDTPRP